jgi:hypothetical protein
MLGAALIVVQLFQLPLQMIDNVDDTKQQKECGFD